MKTIKQNRVILISLIFFIFISFLSIYSASMYLSPTLGKLYYKQMFWYAIGIVFIFLIGKLSMRNIYENSFWIYVANVLLLIGLLLFAKEINGSKSWFIIKGIGSIQPSEFMKVALILFQSSILYHFYKKEKKIKTKKEFQLILMLLLTWAIPSILTFLQPDTGAVIIYTVITFSMLFVSGINKKWFWAFFFLLGGFLVLFFYLYFFQSELFIDWFGSNFFYRIDRLINWQTGSGMQLNNSLAAIGSSGIVGHGFNNTPIYFPEAGTDFIFTVFASNFGLLGSLLLIFLFLFFDLYLLSLSTKVYSLQDRYVIIGILSVIFYQQIQNIGMTMGLLPITGITLPFISYGGSSLLSYMLMIGFLLNILKTDQKKKAYH